MNKRAIRLILLTGILCVAGFLSWILLGPRNPVALLQVVDSAGKPISGAIIRPEGLRTKPGPYVSGWYGWKFEKNRVPNNPVRTNAKGYARVPYPKYVFERIETGTLCFSVEHPDYVPDRPERKVASAPPIGAPWLAWGDYLWGRLRRKGSVAQVDPVVLQKGATLKLSVRPGSTAGTDAVVFAQTSGVQPQDTNFWLHPGPNLLVTSRLPAGQQTIRAVQFDSNGSAWFSPVTKVTAVAGQTTELTVNLTPGVGVHGRLGNSVLRPVHDGRAVAHIWPEGEQPQTSPPVWHAWSKIREDGTFDISGLPDGLLEIVALCDGFVSTNGPGQFPSMHYPQKHLLGTNDLTITLGMEPTASLEVEVMDDQGKPLKDAHVTSWPNVRYGEWSATLLGNDCYNTADSMRASGDEVSLLKQLLNRPVPFRGTSDSSGLALILNLPSDAHEFSVEHARFVLPAADTGFGQKRRQVEISLLPGHTNRVTVRLEPVSRSPIAHY